MTNVFLAGEGDRYFARNKAGLHAFDPERDPPTRLMTLYGLRPDRVLEIGASNGARLAALLGRGVSRAVAVEPSEEAIRDGRERHPAVEFHRGVIERTGIDGPFDLVIVSFVYHWVNREQLLAAAAETDRLVRDGGHLLIADFAPTLPTRVPYHHRPEGDVVTFKQPYHEIFLSTAGYRLIAMLTADHHDGAFRSGLSDADRTAVWLLEKSARGVHTTPAAG